MKKKKLVYIISNINKALAFEWLADSDRLNEIFAVRFLLLNPDESILFRFLSGKGYDVQWIPYRGKQDLPKVIWRIYIYLKAEQIDIVHAHLFDACIAGLTAAKLAGVPQRIYTRHHSTLHHIYFPRAVYYDRFINALATQIVAISKKVEQVLIQKEAVQQDKVFLIHHGFHLNQFSQVNQFQIREVVSRNLIPKEACPKVGVIARYTQWKGIQFIIPAFKELLQKWPKAHLILANAKGDYLNEIKALLTTLPVHTYTEIEFENDIPALYQLFDLYVHVPIDDHSEAFGQTYVEALAAKVPSVFTLSGVASEFVQHKQNAWVVDYKNSEDIRHALEVLMEDKELRARIREQGAVDVHERFGFEIMITKLIDLYNKV